jgi:hypothetical protein
MKILLLNLIKEVFWNCDLSILDYKKDKNIIIERIIGYGLENNEIIMWKMYTYNEIKNVAVNIEYLEMDKIIYHAFVLNIDEKEFKCYGKKQWNKK